MSGVLKPLLLFCKITTNIKHSLGGCSIFFMTCSHAPKGRTRKTQSRETSIIREEKGSTNDENLGEVLNLYIINMKSLHSKVT